MAPIDGTTGAGKSAGAGKSVMIRDDPQTGAKLVRWIRMDTSAWQRMATKPDKAIIYDHLRQRVCVPKGVCSPVNSTSKFYRPETDVP
ncbi:hypothetical protein AB6D20_027750 (plasmid) [Vibrio splendidus]